MNYISKTAGFDDPEVKFYSCDPDAETLSYDTPEEAIEAALDSWLSPKVSVLEHLKSAVGDTITVYAWKRVRMPDDEPDPERVLEDVLERLDEEHGDPDEATAPTAEMEQAAATFCAAIRCLYTVWQCERIGEATVNVDAFVREEHPEWLSQPSGREQSAIPEEG